MIHLLNINNFTKYYLNKNKNMSNSKTSNGIIIPNLDTESRV